LVRQSDNAVIWASNYDTDLSIQSVLEAETAVAEKIATAVAQPFGVIFSSDVAATGGWEAYDCTLSYYSYRRIMTKAALATSQQCLTALIQKYPEDATSLAMLSLTNLDQVRFAYKLGLVAPKDALERASELANRAFAIDSQNARVLQALMLSYFFSNDIPAALEAGAASYALNPNDTEVVGEYGLRLSMSGKWDTGCDLVSKAVSHGAGPAGYYEVGMALCAFMRGDLQAAELWSRMSDLTYNPMHRMVLASILGASGKTIQARQELDWLNANAQNLMPNIKREVTARLPRPEDQEKVFAGLRAAGLALTANPTSN
jgi:tetratricopeptide (TPR) repeat protein